MRALRVVTILFGLVLLLLLSAQPALADVQNQQPHGWTGVLLSYGEDDFLCRYTIQEGNHGWGLIDKFFYSYGQENCNAFNGGEKVMNNNAHLKGPLVSQGVTEIDKVHSELDEPINPAYRYIGTTAWTDNRRYTFAQELPVVRFPDSNQDSVLLHEATLCGERMAIESSTITTSPDTPWMDSPLIQDADGYYQNDPSSFVIHKEKSNHRACGKFIEQTLDSTYSIRATGNTPRRFMGWYSTHQPVTYRYPVYCTDVRLEVLTENNMWNDWDSMKGTYYPMSESNDGIIQRFQNGNYFRFELTYEQNKILGFKAGIFDSSSNVGGVSYRLWCDQPLSPHENSDICTNQEGGDYDETISRCCYKETAGEEEVVTGGENLYCEETGTPVCDGPSCITEFSYEWVTGAIECGGMEQGKYPGDPTGYCCSEQAQYAEFFGHPHLNNQTVQVAPGARQKQCTVDGLTEVNDNYQSEDGAWAYSTVGDTAGVWAKCDTPEKAGLIHGPFACKQNSQEELQWQKCECDPGVDDTTCGFKKEVGLYCEQTGWTNTPQSYCVDNEKSAKCCAYGQYWTDLKGDGYPVACVNGDFIDSSTGIELALVTLEVSS